MKECTRTDKPLVSIVMATYNPRMDWLREQLVSLNDQSYENLELLILDDCSVDGAFEQTRACVSDCITKIPVEIYRNEENLGSTKTFEKLTALARGEYIVYCDQDDVWHEDKIERCVMEIRGSDAVLAFSDMNIIDGEGKKTADSITKVRRHHRFHSGAGLWKTLLFRNFVTGCAMLIEAEAAKAAIPFCPYMVHDHWLALYCSVEGTLLFIDDSLIEYRIHESNQTLVMAGVTSKKSYVKVRIENSLNRLFWLQEKFKGKPDLEETILSSIEWMMARRDNFRQIGKPVMIIWKYRRFNRSVSCFEIVAARLPEKQFLAFITLVRNNLI